MVPCCLTYCKVCLSNHISIKHDFQSYLIIRYERNRLVPQKIFDFKRWFLDEKATKKIFVDVKELGSSSAYSCLWLIKLTYYNKRYLSFLKHWAGKSSYEVRSRHAWWSPVIYMQAARHRRLKITNWISFKSNSMEPLVAVTFIKEMIGSKRSSCKILSEKGSTAFLLMRNCNWKLLIWKIIWEIAYKNFVWRDFKIPKKIFHTRDLNQNPKKNSLWKMI